MATRRAASSRKPTPHTAVMIRKMCRKPSYCHRLVISRPLAVSRPMNSTEKPYISGRDVHSEPRQATPNMAVGTDPSISTSLALWLIRPSTVPASIPASMRFVMMEHASSREEVLSFLGDLKDALAAFTGGLEQYAAATAQLDDRHPGLALDHGLAVYHASLRWIRHTIAALRAAPLPQ